MVTALVDKTRFNEKAMREALAKGFVLATDLADYLVKRGMSFRSAHAVVGRIVRHCLGAHRPIEELSLPELQRFCSTIERDVYDALKPKNCVEQRRTVGGTASVNVRRSLKKLGV